MQKSILAFFIIAGLWSCDYSKSSNGNIDEAYAREEKTTTTHEVEHHDNHVESKGEGHKVSNGEELPSDTSNATPATEAHH